MIAAHTEGKIFECHCGSIFKNIEGLRRHKKSHGVKNIPCKVNHCHSLHFKAYWKILLQDCDLMFNMQTALMQHVKQRHPESYKNRDNKRDTKSATKRSKIKWEDRIRPKAFLNLFYSWVCLKMSHLKISLNQWDPSKFNARWRNCTASLELHKIFIDKMTWTSKISEKKNIFICDVFRRTPITPIWH